MGVTLWFAFFRYSKSEMLFVKIYHNPFANFENYLRLPPFQRLLQVMRDEENCTRRASHERQKLLPTGGGMGGMVGGRGHTPLVSLESEHSR